MTDTNDIDDILASVTRAHDLAHQHNHGPTSSHTLPPHENHTAAQDLQTLTHAWVNEKVAPELLRYPTELMERVNGRIAKQIGSIEDTTASMSQGTNFTLIVQQTELERFKFLVRSFLRVRIAKIDTHPQHYLTLHQSAPQTQTHHEPLLSPQEQTYTQTHQTLLTHHYTSSFLSAFPEKLRRLDDKTGGSASMVEGPDGEKSVFVRCIGFARGSASSSSARRKGAATGTAGNRRRETASGPTTTGFESDEDEDMDIDIDAQDAQTETEQPIEVSCGFKPARTTAQSERAVSFNINNDADRNDDDDDDDGNGRGAEKTVRMRSGEVWLVRWDGVRDLVERGLCELV